MQLSGIELTPAESDVFSSRAGAFGRSELAENIAAILLNSREPTTIILDAPWGEGKTTFLRHLQAHLRRQGVPILLFDAFKFDYISNPITALCGEIALLAKEAGLADETSTDRFTAAAAALAKNVGAKLAGRLVEIATANLIKAADIPELTAISSALSRTSEDAIEALLHEEISEFSKQKRTIETFRASLTDMAANLSAEGQHANLPLVILIDELDRANPDFAVRVIEVVKHFFEVPNVHFLMAMDRNQIESILAGRYGSRFDSASYLEKFYTVLMHFPDRGTEKRDFDVLLDIIEDHFQKYSFSGANRGWIENSSGAIAAIAYVNRLSLRATQKIAAHVALVLASTSSINEANIPLAVALCAMKIARPNLYENARRGTIPFDELHSFLRTDTWGDLLNESFGNWMMDSWLYVLGRGIPNEERQRRIERAFGMKQPNSYLQRFCSSRIDIIKGPNFKQVAPPA